MDLKTYKGPRGHLMQAGVALSFADWHIHRSTAANRITWIGAFAASADPDFGEVSEAVFELDTGEELSGQIVIVAIDGTARAVQFQGTGPIHFPESRH